VLAWMFLLGSTRDALAQGNYVPAAVRAAMGDGPPPSEAAPSNELPPYYLYREGTPLPRGYHLEERPRKGFVTAGWVATGVAYTAGMFGAFARRYENESGWLALPFAGPWITLGRRDYACIGKRQAEHNGVRCAGDVIIAPLILLGMAQAAGGTFLMIGYLSTREYAVRDQSALTLVPSPVGSGYGLSLVGTL
jgi:hypothetical protein